MSYIDFDTYKSLGGTVTDLPVFSRLELDAEDQLNRWTHYRIIDIDTQLKAKIERCMTKIIDFFSTPQLDISSYSNDGISVTYEKPNAEKLLYDYVYRTMPSDYMYAGV